MLPSEDIAFPFRGRPGRNKRMPMPLKAMRIVADDDLAARLERRDVAGDADAAVDDVVTFDEDIGGFLEPDCQPGGAGGMGRRCCGWRRRRNT